MTNFQGGATGQRVTREQVLLWSPVALGGLLALLAAGFQLVPALQQLQRNQQQLADLQAQDARVPLLRQQLLKQKENLDKAQQRERQILQLIAGSGDISTFMSQLGKEAQRSGVQLESYEPTTAPAVPAAPPAPTKPEKPDPKLPPPPPSDPLLAQGLQKTNLLITARGTGPQLLEFLRRLERLSLLVVRSDLALTYEPGQAGANGAAALPGATILKINLALYSKAPASQARPADGAPPAKS